MATEGCDRLALVVLLSVCSSGCAGLRGAPDRSFEPAAEVAALRGVIAPATQLRCRLSGDLSQRTACRDLVVRARMRIVDINFAEFERGLNQQSRGLSFATDVALLGVNAAGAATAVLAATRALAAAGAALVGTRAAFENDVLVQKTALAIRSTMNARRDRIAFQIQMRLRQPADIYDLTAALGDVDRYESAGTVAGAIEGITETANAERQAAAELRVVSGFARTTTADQLRAFVNAGLTPAEQGERERTIVDAARALGFTEVDSAAVVMVERGQAAEERRRRILERISLAKSGRL